MHSAVPHIAGKARLIVPALLGWVIGTAFQLQQVALDTVWVYACFLSIAPVLCAAAAIKIVANKWRLLLVAVALGLAGYGATGLRASAFVSQALSTGLEGRDIVVTGVVASMPQRNDTGLRFQLDVDSAQWQGQPVSLPPRLYLGWYSGVFGGGASMVGELQRQPAAIEAGERWQMTVRLKAPHGASNPFGFDFELWLWEQGLQATGYVRAGPKDPPPLRMAQTGWHPVERARQQVRDRVFERVTERKYAGLIAALVAGDQNAIDRVDWDVFRATGVSHLMAISGLHTCCLRGSRLWGLAGFGDALLAYVCGCRRPVRPLWAGCCWRPCTPSSAAGAYRPSVRC